MIMILLSTITSYSVAYMDVGEGRVQGCGSFENLANRLTITCGLRLFGHGRPYAERGGMHRIGVSGYFAYRDVDEGRERGCDSFDQQCHEPDLLRGSLTKKKS